MLHSLFACTPQVLLELGADINQPNPGNQTRPVQAAALRGAADALAFLANRGANLAVKGALRAGVFLMERHLVQPSGLATPLNVCPVAPPPNALTTAACRPHHSPDKLGMSVLSYCCAHGFAVWQDLPACPPENCPHAKCLRALFSRK